MGDQRPASRSLRILSLVATTHVEGGRDRVHLDLCRGLADRGHRIVLAYGTPGPEHDAWVAAAHEHLRLPTARGSVHPRRPLTTGVAVARSALVAARLRPDVVLVPTWSHVTLGAVLASVCGAALVPHVHDRPERFGRQTGWAMRRASRVIAVSEAQTRLLRAAGAPARSLATIRNGIDLGRFRPPSGEERAAARADLGITDADLPVVTYVGRLTEDKGPDVLLCAGALLCSRGREVVVAVVGAPPHRPPDVYARRLRDRYTEPWVRWVDETRDVVPSYWASDLVVVPSRGFDAYPTVALEAMACGVPVVASDAGGLRESVGRLGPHHLVPPDDPESLARAIGVALEGGRRVSPRSIAEAAFAVDLAVDAVAALLDEAVGEVGHGRRARLSRFAPGRWGRSLTR